MNKHFAGIFLSAALALAAGAIGPADADVAPYVVGGADCNHSDIVTHDCVEINGRPTPCVNVSIGAAVIQTCLDELTTSATVCTQNNCQNATKDKENKPLSGCTKKNCGS